MILPEGLDPDILLPAFAAGLLVLATHVPMGMAVLQRGIIFLDLATAQIAGLGVILVNALAGHEAETWLVQGGAVLAALLGALFLSWMEKKAPHRQEATIGVAFVVAACSALLLMSHDPHGAEHLQDLLVGQILWSSWSALIPLALVTAVILGAWFGTRIKQSPLGFYLLFAITITASVQVVGVYLVFASLIVPALGAGERLIRAYAMGAMGYALGLVASGLFDLPGGAAIVIALTVITAPNLLRGNKPI